jgi:zinc and cadmium transporter
MNILVFLALFLPVLIAGGSVFFFRTNNRILKLITAFSGAYLLAISFFDVIPEIYKGNSGIEIGLFILLGFFIQLILDYITKGVEHGHQHHDCKEHHPNEVHTTSHLPVMPVIIGLFIHSFLEGMPLAETFNMPQLRNTLLTGIAIHNIPIAIILVSLALAGEKKNFIKAGIMLLIFSFGGPLGVLVSNWIGVGAAGEADHYFSILMAVVVGIFLHISTVILFETDENHKFNWLKLLVILGGATAAWFVA